MQANLPMVAAAVLPGAVVIMAALLLADYASFAPYRTPLIMMVDLLQSLTFVLWGLDWVPFPRDQVSLT